MKILWGTLLLLTIGLLPVMAQSGDFTASAGSEFREFTKDPDGPRKGEPTEVKPLKPRGTGVIYYIDKDGLVIISPDAPPRYEYGQRFLTKSPFPAYSAVGSDDPRNEGDREFGGIKIFGWDF